MVDHSTMVVLMNHIASDICYVQGKIFRGSHVSTKISNLEFFVNIIFSDESFLYYSNLHSVM